jgi:hypothetical protein
MAQPLRPCAGVRGLAEATPKDALALTRQVWRGDTREVPKHLQLPNMSGLRRSQGRKARKSALMDNDNGKVERKRGEEKEEY